MHDLHQNLYKKILKIKHDINLLGLHQEIQKDEEFEKISKELRNLLRYLDVLSSYGGSKKKISSRINLNKLLLDLVRNHNSEINKKKIKLKMDLTRHMRLINANYEKLYKAFELLLLNAIESVSQKNIHTKEKYTPIIEIKTRMQETTIEVIIKDNGIGTGYLLSTQERIKGLDLSLSQLSIQSLGGTFSLRNIPNVGSKIVMKIPSAPIPIDSDRNDNRTDKKKIKREKRTPLVFRNRSFWILGTKDYAVEMVQNLLMKNGATYQNIENPKTLSKLIGTRPIPDAFLINISSEREIPDFILSLKQVGAFEKSLFFVPSECLVTLKKKQKTYGIIHIISKPFPIESLMETLTMFFAKKR